MFQKLVFAMVVLMASSGGVAVAGEEEHGGEGSKKFGNHKAVTEFSAEDGFKLSDRAIKAMDVRFRKLEQGPSFAIPKSALVQLKATTGVYRRYEGWISYVLVETAKVQGDSVIVRSEDLQSGDEIAISGTDFLRMTEVDITTDTVAGCAH